jgi:hypothetical protein
MKKTFQIFHNDGTKITFDATVKSTRETNIKVREFFEQGSIACLLLSIEHDQLNTLLDLTKMSQNPYTLIYFDNYYVDRYYFAAAAYSNNETESPFFINTQFKKILFIPSSFKLSPNDIDKGRDMKAIEGKERDLIFQQKVFLNGYGKFPYVILKTGYAIYMQIPINFNTKGDFVNYPGTNIENISDELLANYEKDKTSELHDIIIKHCQWLKAKIEAEKNREARICLVEGPEIAYYFDIDEINFTKSIPTGGTLVTQQNKILAMNANHYL